MTPEEKQLILDFRENLLVDVNNELETHGLTGEEAFAQYACNELEQAEIVDDFESAFFDSSKGRKKYHLNGYSFSTVDGFLNLFIVVFHGDSEPKSLGTADIRKALDSVTNFIVDKDIIKQSSSEANDYLDCIQIIDEYSGNFDGSIRKYRIFILTDVFVSDPAKKLIIEDINGVSVEPLVFDIQKLFELSIAQEGRGTVKIDFNEFSPWRVHCVPAGESCPPNTFQYKSYIGVVPGIILADIYDNYGARLLEGNVRSFLSSKGTVNKKIRETLLRFPEQFFAFNNGISVTASNVSFDEDYNLIYAEEFQIINGGQTTACISNTRFCDKGKVDLSKVNVLMKLTVTQNGMSEDAKQKLLADISRASNQQNKVSDADFFSTHPFHVAIEKLAEITPAPSVSATQLRTYWFYERARGQYNQKQMKLNKTQRLEFKKQYPPKQKITKTDLAKYRYSWEEKPYIVSKGAQSNFQAFAQEISGLWEKGDNERAKFNAQYFKNTVSLAIMFIAIGDIVSNQPWYTGSFRANIVTYSISMLHYLLRNQFTDRVLDLDKIWRNQALPPVLQKVFKILTTKVNDEITNTRNGIVNFTQRCKQKSFWETMQSNVILDLKAFTGFEQLLIELEDQRREDKAARSVGKLMYGVELQTMVISKGPDFWCKVRDFAIMDKRVGLSPKEEAALTTVIGGRVPPDFVCKTLQFLLRKCQENGFNEE